MPTNSIQIRGGARQFFYYTIPENMKAVVNFDLLACEDDYRGFYTNAFSIKIFLNDFNEIGLPTPDENEKSNLIMDQFIGYLTEKNIDCKEVGVLTYYGLKEACFQMPKEVVDSFKKAFKEWVEKQDLFKIEIQEQAGGWDFFDLKIKPTIEDQFQIKNRSTIAKIRETDPDPKKVYTLENVFIGKREHLEVMIEELRKVGFYVDENQRTKALANEDGFSLMATIESELDLDKITSMTSYLLKLSRDIGVEYDGWGVSLLP